MELELADICTSFGNDFNRHIHRRDTKGQATRGGSIPRHPEPRQPDIYEKLHNMKRDMNKFKNSLMFRDSFIENIAAKVSSEEKQQHEFLRPRIIEEDTTSTTTILHKRIQDLQKQNNELASELRIINKKISSAKFENERNEFALRRDDDKSQKSNEGFYAPVEKKRGYSQSRDQSKEDIRELSAKLNVLNKELEKTRQIHEAKVLELKAEYKKRLSIYLSKLSMSSICIGQFLTSMQNLQMGVVKHDDKNIEALRNEFEHQKSQLTNLSKELKVFDDSNKKELRHVNLASHKKDQTRLEGGLSEFAIKRKIPKPPSMIELSKDSGSNKVTLEMHQRVINKHKETEAALRKQVRELEAALGKRNEGGRQLVKEEVKKRVEKVFKSIERLLLTRLAKLDHKVTIEAGNLDNLKTLLEHRLIDQEMKPTARFQLNKKQSLKNIEAENNELRIKVAKMQEIINKYKEDTKSIVSQKDSTIKQYKAKTDQLTKDNKIMLKARLCTMLESYKNMFFKEISKINFRIPNIKDKVLVINQRSSSSSKRILSEKIGRMMKDVVRRFNGNVQRAIDKYNKKISFLEATMLILQERFLDINDKVVDFNINLKAKLNHAIIYSKQFANSSIERVSTLKNNIEERLVEVFNNNLNSLEERINKLSEMYKRAKEEIVNKLDENDQLVNEMATVKASRQLENELEEKEEIVTQMKRLTIDLSNEISSMQTENIKLKEDITKQLNEAKLLKDKLNKEIDLRNKDLKVRKELESELISLKTKQESLIAQNTLLQDEVKDKEKIKNTFMSAIHDIVEQIKTHRETVNDLIGISLAGIRNLHSELNELNLRHKLNNLKAKERIKKYAETVKELKEELKLVKEGQVEEQKEYKNTILMLQEEIERKSLEFEHNLKSESMTDTETIKQLKEDIRKLRNNLNGREMAIDKYKDILKTSIKHIVSEMKDEVLRLKEKINGLNSNCIQYIDESLREIILRYEVKCNEAKEVLVKYSNNIKERIASHYKELNTKLLGHSRIHTLVNEINKLKEVLLHVKKNNIRQLAYNIQLMHINYNNLQNIVIDRIQHQANHLKMLQGKLKTFITMRNDKEGKYKEKIGSLLAKLEEEKESNRVLIASTKDSSLAEIKRLRDNLANAHQDAIKNNKLHKATIQHLNANIKEKYKSLVELREYINDVKLMHNKMNTTLKEYKEKIEVELNNDKEEQTIKLEENQQTINALNDTIEQLQDELTIAKADLEAEKINQTIIIQQLSDKLLAQQEEAEQRESELLSKVNKLSLDIEEQKTLLKEEDATNGKGLVKQSCMRLKETVCKNIEIEVKNYEGYIESLNERIEELNIIISNSKLLLKTKIKLITEKVMKGLNDKSEEFINEIVNHIKEYNELPYEILTSIKKLICIYKSTGTNEIQLVDLRAKNIKLIEELRESQELIKILNGKLMDLQVDRSDNENVKSMPERFQELIIEKQAPGKAHVIYKSPSSVSLQGSDAAASSNLSGNTCPLPIASIDKSSSAEMEAKITAHMKRLIIKCLQSVPLKYF